MNGRVRFIKSVLWAAAAIGAGAVAAAVLAMTIAFLDMVPAVRPDLGKPVAVGFGPLSPDGRFWTWTELRGIGCRTVNAGIYGTSDYVRRENGIPPTATQSRAVPMWSYVAENPLPPTIETPAGVTLSVSDSAFGWPWLGLAYRIELLELSAISESQAKLEASVGLSTNPGTLQQVPRVTRGIWWPTFLSTEVNSHTGYVPTHILWPGFLLNTLFWSAVIASPFWLRRGLVAWRAARRRSNGLCPNCGYARGSINPQHPCPECGKSDPPAPQSAPSHPQTP